MHCYFVPPYLLRRLSTAAADPAAVGSGELTLRVDARLRADREVAPQRTTLLATPTAGKRVIHDAGHQETLPGPVVRTDDAPPTGDAAVDEAFDSSGQVWDLFAEEFGRASVDGEGSTLSISVHYGQNYDNAFWDGRQLVFGDGDGVIFDRFTKPMDVMAHEFTHGVTQFTASLTYQGQSGALNESVSDVFASMAKQRELAQTADQADWLIGQGLFLPSINATALRSMIAPGTAYDDPQLGKDPQVGSMADYVDTSDDNGGVHINSGIPNRAFALAAVALRGSSWEKAGRVWYDALTGGSVGPDTDFRGFADATVASATSVFPDEPAVADAVRTAWTEVGVLGAVVAPAPAPAGPAATQTVAVRRTGGYAGQVRTARLDLDIDPDGPEVRELLMRVNRQSFSESPARPDRFVYSVQYGDLDLTVPEHDLTPELDRVVKIVLDRGGVELG